MASAIGGIAGALIGGSASKSAASKQANAANAATALQREIWNQTREDQTPYREAGYNALRQLGDFQEPSLRAMDVMDEPGYQFGLQQGLGNIQNTAAARGGLYSGNALKALTQYGNDYATTKYGDAWNRLNSQSNTRWNRLASLAGVGQTANSQVAQAGQNYANQAGNIGMSNANAQGAAGMQQAGLWSNAINGVISDGNRANWWMGSNPSSAPGSDWLNRGGGFYGPNGIEGM